MLHRRLDGLHCHFGNLITLSWQPSPKPLSGLTKRLIQDGLIDLDAAEKYGLEATKARRPLVSYLVRENIVSAEAIAAAGHPVNLAPLSLIWAPSTPALCPRVWSVKS